jgi:hypothetical protein
MEASGSMTAYRRSPVFTLSFLSWALAFIVTFVIVYATFGARRQANYVRGWNDFLSFYAGGKLAFPQSVYDPAAISVQQAKSGHIAPAALRFIRPPHHAMVLSPLTSLPVTILLLSRRVSIEGTLLMSLAARS